MLKKHLPVLACVLLYAACAIVLFTISSYVGYGSFANVKLPIHPFFLCVILLMLGALLIYLMYRPGRKPLVLTQKGLEQRRHAGGILLLLAIRLVGGVFSNLGGVFAEVDIGTRIMSAIYCAICVYALILFFGNRRFPGVYIAGAFLNVAVGVYMRSFMMAAVFLSVEAAVILYLFLSENVAVLYRTRRIEILEPVYAALENHAEEITSEQGCDKDK